MTTTTFFANTNDGYIESANATYSTARSGGTLTAFSVGQDFNCGQALGFSVYEAFVSFDTSSIPDTDDVTNAVLSLYVSSDQSATDFVLEARSYSWSAGGLTTGDYVAGASLSSNLLVASLDTSLLVGGAYNDFSRADYMTQAINKTGVTDFILDSAKTVAGTQNSTNDYVIFVSANGANAPKLTVTYAPQEVNSSYNERIVPSSLRWRA